MSLQPGRGPVVIDTDVYGAELVPGSRLAELYQAIIAGRPAFISFQTAAELRYGALLRNWVKLECGSSRRGSRLPRRCIRGRSSS